MPGWPQSTSDGCCMAEAVIGLGSNIGDGQVNLCRAWKMLALEPDIDPQGLSSPYATEPVGMASKNWFTNGVGFAYTNLAPRRLLNVLLRIETELGRNRAGQGKKWADRTVDLDLLYYDDLVCAAPELVIPHPGIQNRLFVLLPLAELLPDKLHPVLGMTAKQMIKQLMAAAGGASLPEVKKMQWRQDVLALK